MPTEADLALHSGFAAVASLPQFVTHQHDSTAMRERLGREQSREGLDVTSCQQQRPRIQTETQTGESTGAHERGGTLHASVGDDVVHGLLDPDTLEMTSLPARVSRTREANQRNDESGAHRWIRALTRGAVGSFIG